MKLKKSHWTIAYRKGRNRNWLLVKNPKGGWAADPFLFEYNGEIYLFAEIMSYQTGKGYIGYCKYNGQKFGQWKSAIKEAWHLSYPDVFEWNGKIYMLPEQYQSGEIALYECVQFPSKWKRLSPLKDNGQYVDSTVLFQNDRAWLFTMRMNPEKHSEGELLRAELFSPEKLGKFKVIDKAGGLYKRPGGYFFMRNDKVYRVAQNCNGGYGRGLIFYLVEKCDDEKYEEKEEKKITVENIVIINRKKYSGVHTYSQCNVLEVIDLKRMVINLEETFFRIQRKMYNFLIRGDKC